MITATPINDMNTIELKRKRTHGVWTLMDEFEEAHLRLPRACTHGEDAAGKRIEFNYRRDALTS